MEGMSGFCRACLVKFDDPNVLIQYTEKNRRQFLYLTGIQVKKNDQFIFQLCKDCYQSMILACKFKKLCRTSDKQFKQYLALNADGGTKDFEEFLRTNESTFRYPLNNEFSTPIYKPQQDNDNASTCTSFRSFMKDLIKADDLPDTAYKIIEEVIQEEADIMDDSIDSQWLQDDVGFPDLNFDLSFSMFRSPYATDSPQDNRFALAENRTPDHQYAPYIEPYTPNRDLNTVTQSSVNNTLIVNTVKVTKNTIQSNNITCQKDLTKVKTNHTASNRIKSEVVEFDAVAVKETLKDKNNECFDDYSTKEENFNISQVESEITIKQESDVNANKYNLRKVKSKSRNVRDIENLSDYVRTHFKNPANKPNKTKKRTKQNATVRKKFFKGRIISDCLNASTQSDSFSLSEFNLSENDIILKTEDENTKNMMPLNQDLTKYTASEIDEKFAVQTNMIDLKQYQEIDNIVTNEYNKLENTPITYDDKSAKQNYSILDIGSYQTDIVADDIYGDGNFKTEQNYNIENIVSNIKIENIPNDDLLNIGLNHHETVHDIIDINIELALNQSTSDLVPLEDLLNPSGEPLTSMEPDQKTDLPNKSDIKQYLESFIEEIKTPLETKVSQQPKTGITILENIKIKGPDDEKIIERFINDNKDTYVYSLEKLQQELVVEISKMYDMMLRRCELCNMNYKSEHRLRYHLTKKHKLKVPETKKVKYVVPKNYICSVCGKPFERRTEMERHVKTHYPTVYTCDICKVNFEKKSAIRMHMNSHLMAHKIKRDPPDMVYKTLKCDICGLRMKDKGNMITHRKRHFQVFKFQCLECNKQCLSKSEFTAHVRVHTGEKPFECGICHKCCGRRDAYYKHIRKHHENNLFHCPFCNLKCLKRSLINQHLQRNKVCREKKRIMNGQKQDEINEESQNKVTNPVIELRVPETELILPDPESFQPDVQFEELLIPETSIPDETPQDNINEESQNKVTNPVMELRIPETEFILPDPESFQPDVQFEELLIPETSIPDETPEATQTPLIYVEDDIPINLFPQNNNYEEEYVINPSLF